MPFLDVKTDFAFKKVFGSEESKDILLSFLNAFLDFGTETIVDLTLVDPYQIPLLVGMKDTYVDVQAQLSNGTQVIIEMQVLNVPAFEKRVLYNAAKAYSTQLSRGDHYTLLNPVIALTITDFIMFPDSEAIISYFKLIEKQRFIHYSDDIELIFVELPKFDQTESQLTSLADKWLYFLKNIDKLETIPTVFAHDEAIHHAFHIANIASLSAQELKVQWKKIDFIMIQKSLQEEAEKAQERAVQAEKQVEQAEKQVEQAGKQVEQAEKQAKQAKEHAKQAKEHAKQAEKQAKQESQRAEQLEQTLTKQKQALTTVEQVLQQTDKTTLLQIAQQLLKTNTDISVIKQITGLDDSEITALRHFKK